MNIMTSPTLGSYFAQERETLRTEPVIRSELLALGVTSLRADYDGSGDEGQINDVRFFEDEDLIEDARVGDGLRTRVEDLLYALLTCRHTGWDQNDGAYGHFEWDLVDESMEHEHNDRVLTYITSVQMGFELAVEQEELP